jgi:hypothetical protein
VISGFKIIKKIAPLFLSVFILSIVCGCSYVDGVTTMLKDDGRVVFTRIAVVPFQSVNMDDAAVKAVGCPLCGLVFSAERYPGGAEKIVENVFVERLRTHRQFVVIPPERVGGIYERVAADSLKVDMLDILKKVGSELEADGIVFGYVYRYRERKGYAYSAEKPASVAFEIHLIRVNDGALVWRGIFDKTQSSLMENILQISSFYRGRGQWVTAKELITEGLDEVMKKFPGLH